MGIPQDEWAHRDALHEWWYVNSHLSTSDGRRLGLVVAFFPDYMLFGLADKLGRKMIRTSVMRGARLESSSSGVRFGNNRFVSANGPGCYSLACGSDELALDLSLKAEKAPLLVNQTGLIREGLLGSSWYYSLTRMRVEGQLAVAGDSRHVSGIGWIDRQWGRWEDMGIGGWEWFSLQLSNGSEVLATQIYSPVTGRTCSKVLSMKRRDSSEYHSTNFAVRRTETLTGGLSGSKYGKKWVIEAPGVLRLVVEVDFEDQEFHKGLWEGCCKANGVLEGEEVTGMGYAEQVDRAQGPLSERLSLAAAPGHFVLQNLLGRANLGLWDLSERLKVWRVLSLRRSAT